MDSAVALNPSIVAILEAVKQLPSDWHGAGTVTPSVLDAIAHHATQRPIHHSIETGSGRTTLLLSHLSRNHKVFALDGGNSVALVRSSTLLNAQRVEFIEGFSQQTLPAYSFSQPIQLALIDGPHGYPFPDLEYYYIYPHLEENGLLIVDDIQIPTIRNLFAFLKEDEMFELLEVVDHTAFFKRTNAPLLDPLGDGWWLQKYNTNRYNQVSPQKELVTLRSQLRTTQAALKQAEAQLARSQGEIEAMKTSKFWKLRESWFRFKRLVGLPIIEDSP